MSLENGQIVEGVIQGITNFGAFVNLDDGKKGLVHISEISYEYVKDITSLYKVGDPVRVKILQMEANGKIALSIKQTKSNPNVKKKQPAAPPKAESFEDMLTKFKQSSEERMSDIKKNQDNRRNTYSRRRG